MTLRPFSDHDRGLFVSVDGPSGAGKSTVVQHLAQLLVASGETVHLARTYSNRFDLLERLQEALGRLGDGGRTRRVGRRWPR